LQKSFHLSHPDKIELTKSPSLLKIKNTQRSADMTKTAECNNDNGLQTRWTEGQLITAAWQNWRFSASYDNFASKQTLVLRINFGGGDRQLRQAANR
jgi:hypothetical protein